MGERERMTVSLESLIKAQAFGLGFDLAGITTLGAAETAGAFEDWLSAGYAGDMTYLPKGAEKRRDTRLPFDGAITAIVVGSELRRHGAEWPGCALCPWATTTTT